MNYTGLLDMINGGGAGASGTEFKGGAFSGLLNSIGVKPRGYQDTMQGMAGTRPQMRPQQPMPQPAPQPAPQPMQRGPQARPNNAPQPSPMQYGPQQMTPDTITGMSDQDFQRFIETSDVSRLPPAVMDAATMRMRMMRAPR